MELDNVRLRLGVDASDWRSGLSTAATALNGFGSQAGRTLDDVGRRFDKVGESIRKFVPAGSSAMLLGLGAGVAVLAGALALSIGPAIQFESAFAGVIKTVDATAPQLEAIRSGILGLSAVMPASAVEIANVAAAAGQLGVAQEDILDFTKTMVMLGETTNLSSDEAATSFARFVNITDSGTGNVDRLGSSVVALGNSMATTEAEIVEFGMRLAGAGALVGMTDDEIMALAATWSSMGVNAEAGGTAVSRVIKTMSQAAETGGRELDLMADTAGMTAVEFANLIRNDPTQALYRFIAGMGDMRAEGGPVLQLLADLGLSEIRVSDALLRASGNSDLLAEALNTSKTAYAENTAMTKEYAARVETTAAQLEIFRNRIVAVGIAFGTPALRTIVDVVDAIGDGVEHLVDVLGPAMGQIGEFAGGVARAFATLAGAIAVPALQAAATALQGAATTLEGLFAVLNAIPGAATAVGVALAGMGLLRLAGGVSALRVEWQVLRGTMSGTMVQQAAWSSGISAMTGGLAVAAVAVGAFASAFGDADRNAEAFGQSLRDAAFEDGVLSLRSLANAARVAAEESKQLDARGSWLGETFRGLGRALTDQSVSLSDVVRGSRELASSQDEAADAAAGLAAEAAFLEFILSQWGGQLGMTAGELQAVALASDIPLEGILNPDTMLESEAALKEAAAAIRDVSDATGLSTEALLEGQFTLDQYAGSLDLTAGALEWLALNIAEVDTSELMSGEAEKFLEADAAIREVVVSFDRMAAAAGQSTQEFVEQKQAASDLVASLDEVETAISGVRSAQEAMESASFRLEEAQIRLAEALKGDDFAEVAAALGDLNVAYATSGVSASDAAGRQRELYAELQRLGEQAGLSREDVDRLAERWLLLTQAEIAELTVTGQEVIEDAEARVEDLHDSVNADFTARMDAETEDAAQAIIDMTGRLMGWDALVGIGTVDADKAPAERAIGMAQTALRTWGGSSAAALVGALDHYSGRFSGAHGQLGHWGRSSAAATVGINDRASGPLASISRQLDGINGRVVSSVVRTEYRYVGFQSAARANGGIDLVPPQSFSSGGMPEPAHHAHIAPAGAYRLFAEWETGGEAYIPLAPSKRLRSEALLATVADRFGLDLVPRHRSYADGFAPGVLAAVTAANARPSSTMTIALDLGGIDVDLSGAVLGSDWVQDRVRAGVDEALSGFTGRLAKSFESLRGF